MLQLATLPQIPQQFVLQQVLILINTKIPVVMKSATCDSVFIFKGILAWVDLVCVLHMIHSLQEMMMKFS